MGDLHLLAEKISGGDSDTQGVAIEQKSSTGWVMITDARTSENYADQVRRAARIPNTAQERADSAGKFRKQNKMDDDPRERKTSIGDFRTRVLSNAMVTVSEINRIIEPAPFQITYSDYPRIGISSRKFLIENLFNLTMKKPGPLEGRPAPSLELALSDDGTVIAVIIGILKRARLGYAANR